MPTYIALLRAVNVGGTGKLPMAELKAMCEAAGFERVQTYIASGNAVFEAAGTEQQAQAIIASSAIGESSGIAVLHDAAVRKRDHAARAGLHGVTVWSTVKLGRSSARGMV